MKVDAKLVVELKREVGLQIARLQKMIEQQGARDSWLESMYRLKVLKRLLKGLLDDGELVLTGWDGNEGTKQVNEGVLMKLARLFRMVNEDEMRLLRNESDKGM